MSQEKAKTKKELKPYSEKYDTLYRVDKYENMDDCLNEIKENLQEWMNNPVAKEFPFSLYTSVRTGTLSFASNCSCMITCNTNCVPMYCNVDYISITKINKKLTDGEKEILNNFDYDNYLDSWDKYIDEIDGNYYLNDGWTEYMRETIRQLLLLKKDN